MSQRMGWLLLLIFAIISGCSPQRETPISPLFTEATSVRLFLEQYPNEAQFEWDRKHPNGIEINAAQRKQLNEAMYIETNDDKSFTACFIPHHFFRYFDKSGKQIGEISVCFCCQQVRIEPFGKKLNANQYVEARYTDIAKLVEELGVSTRVNCVEKVSE